MRLTAVTDRSCADGGKKPKADGEKKHEPPAHGRQRTRSLHADAVEETRLDGKQSAGAGRAARVGKTETPGAARGTNDDLIPIINIIENKINNSESPEARQEIIGHTASPCGRHAAADGPQLL